MNILRFIAVASAAAFIAISTASDAYAGAKAEKAEKITPKKENQILKKELDSLKAEIKKYQEIHTN